jgi:2-amino-4-hydroxy-6-hydroxymethyldihydropteridine diphosphokinase
LLLCSFVPRLLPHLRFGLPGAQLLEMSDTRQAFIGVGANLGDRWGAIREAYLALKKVAGVLAVEVSPVYETAPVGVKAQPKFLNLVFGLETTLKPEELMLVLRTLELAAGRCRAKETRWGPRKLDLDMLFYEGETRANPMLTLPHPRVWERAFVTVPLRELLSHSSRFQRPEWVTLRGQLETAPTGPGVELWKESKVECFSA